MKHHRHAAYSMCTPESWRLLDMAVYSAFKYGCAASTSRLASSLAALIIQKIDVDKEYMITSAAYKNIPTASTNLLDYVLRQLKADYRFSRFTIKRNQVYATDFASLSPAERFHLIKQVDLEVSATDIERKKVIVIDDAYVSGAHEQNMLRAFDERPDEVHFFYLADLSGLNRLTTEEKLNHVAVKSLPDLQKIMETGNILLNARILKFLLGYPDLSELLRFMITLDFNLLNRIYLGSVLDGYDQLPDYRVNFSLIKRIISNYSFQEKPDHSTGDLPAGMKWR